MKKILFGLLFVLAFLIGKAQPDVAPTDTAFHNLPTYAFRWYTADSSFWAYMGKKYGSFKVASNSRMEFLLDSLSNATGNQFIPLLAATTTAHYTGFPNRTATSLSFNDGSHTLSLTATNDTIWIKGKAYNINTKIKQLSEAQEAVSGLYWFWLKVQADTIALDCDIVAPGFDKCLVASVYYNTTTNAGIVSDERHWMGRDQWMHEYLHECVGAMYGGTGLTGTFGNTTFTITNGEFYDEDIEHTLGSDVSTAKVMYHNGSSEWTWDISTTPYKLTSGNLRYNNGTTLATADNNKYVNQFVFDCGDIAHPIHIFVGTTQHNTIELARAAPIPSLGALSSAENKLIYKIIYKNTGGTPVFQEAIDYRKVSSLPSENFLATDHGTLSGLQDLDHSAGAIINTPANNITRTTVQAALNQMDSIKRQKADTLLRTGTATIYDLEGYTIKNDSSKLYQRRDSVVTSISSTTRNTQYPSGKLLYDQLLLKAAASGSGNYIQNQRDAAQSANMWIDGSGRFGSGVFDGEIKFTDNSNGAIRGGRYSVAVPYLYLTANDNGGINSTGIRLETYNLGSGITALELASTGAATFISTIKANGGTFTDNIIIDKEAYPNLSIRNKSTATVEFPLIQLRDNRAGGGGDWNIENGRTTIGNLEFFNSGTKAYLTTGGSFWANGAITANTALTSGSLSGSGDRLIYANSSGALTSTEVTMSGGIFNYGGTKTFSNAFDLVSREYVDATTTGLAPKLPCDLATTTGQNLDLNGVETIDGAATTSGSSRILVKNQSTTSQNGVYIAQSGAWTRSTDLDTWAELYKAYVVISGGSANIGTSWICTIGNSGTIDSDPITWQQFGIANTITAGIGLTRSGDDIHANVDGTTIEIATDTIRLKTMTSATLAGRISNETGSGALVFASSPTFSGTVSGITPSMTGSVALADSIGGSLGKYATGKALQTHSLLTTSAHGGIAPSSGSANYIQNQNTGAQTGNIWIDGMGKFGNNLYVTNDNYPALIIESPTSTFPLVGLKNTAQSSQWNIELGRTISGNLEFYNSGTIANLTPSGNFTTTGLLKGSRLESFVAAGTAPIIVESTTMVGNLNADLLDGQHGNYYATATGSANYIQNQNYVDQDADIRINGDISTTSGSVSTVNGYFSGGVTARTLGTINYVFPENAGGAGTVPTSNGSGGVTWEAKDAVNTSVQALSGTSVAWNVNSGVNATLSISGTTTITLSNLVAGMTGNITIRPHTTTNYTVTVAGYTNKITPMIRAAANQLSISAFSNPALYDIFSWYYDGNVVIWSGTKNVN